jgi:hypothetical protein
VGRERKERGDNQREWGERFVVSTRMYASFHEPFSRLSDRFFLTLLRRERDRGRSTGRLTDAGQREEYACPEETKRNGGQRWPGLKAAADAASYVQLRRLGGTWGFGSTAEAGNGLLPICTIY